MTNCVATCSRRRNKVAPSIGWSWNICDLRIQFRICIRIIIAPRARNNSDNELISDHFSSTASRFELENTAKRFSRGGSLLRDFPIDGASVFPRRKRLERSPSHSNANGWTSLASSKAENLDAHPFGHVSINISKIKSGAPLDTNSSGFSRRRQLTR